MVLYYAKDGQEILAWSDYRYGRLYKWPGSGTLKYKTINDAFESQNKFLFDSEQAALHFFSYAWDQDIKKGATHTHENLIVHSMTADEIGKLKDKIFKKYIKDRACIN